MWIADVAVENSSIQFDQLFSYEIPDHLVDRIEVGQGVLVPFGRGNRKRQGIVLSVYQEEKENVKEILSIITEGSVLPEEFVQLSLWIKEHTFSTYFDAVRPMIPAGLLTKQRVRYRLVNNLEESKIGNLTKEEQEMITLLATKKKGLSEATFEKHFPNLETREIAVQSLLQKGILLKEEERVRRVQDETVLMVIRTERERTETARYSEKQKAILDFLEETPSISLKELLYYVGGTRSVVDGLSKKGLVRYQEEEVYRNPIGSATEQDIHEIVLSEEQEIVTKEIASLMEEALSETVLLHGITGSGKTEIFCKLIESVLENGQQGILLVPEIALTPQMITRFTARFGEKVAVLHSRLSVGERLDEYKRMKRGKAAIAIGTRSAIFAPFDNIGLIIIDEEQEYSYKSESAPRYHARDVAKFRAKWNRSLLLLASATPSIESYYQAKKGKYHLFELKERYGNSRLPGVTIVDLGDEVHSGEKNLLSHELIHRQKECLEKNEQSIYLLNRRGYQTVVMCTSCDTVIECKNCSIPMTYHQKNGRLLCHCCGNNELLPKTCPSCGKETLAYRGLGTQRLEEQLQLTFPEAKILRMDLDTTLTKHSHENHLTAFRNGEYDMMIGTQMVAKGLDFPNVTLVGVLLADQMLYAEDFRAYERAFSLLTQVVGRSGRGDKEGNAIIQTFTPYNPILKLAAEQDYPMFYEEEIAMRKLMLYPPFTSFTVIGFAAPSEHVTRESAMIFSSMLQQEFTLSDKKVPIRMLGPTASSVKRSAGKYRYKLVLKCIDCADTRQCIQKALERFSSSGVHRTVQVFIDMNYYGSL